jgi:hypothetical protein
MYSFLNSATGEFWEVSRNVAEDWFSRFPDSEKADLKSRFTSADNAQRVAAHWELYLHEYLLRCGYTVEAHPLRDHGVRSPDFLASDGIDSFYLEATTIDLPHDQHREDKLRRPIFDAIQRKVRSGKFVLDIESVVDGKSSPRTDKLCADLNSWLNGLNPNNCLVGNGRPLQFPATRIVFADSWIWNFTALPWLSNEPPRSMIQMYPAQGGVITDHRDMSRNLRQKADRYGEFDRPFVLAVTNPRVHAGDLAEVQQALFGLVGEKPDSLCEGSWNEQYFGGPPSLWLNRDGPTHTNVVGVVYLSNLATYTIAHQRLTAWVCPWADSFLSEGLIADRIHLDCDSQNFTLDPALQEPHELFGLPDGWPNANPWPDS